MNHYFFDSSALIKRYIVEKGTPWVQSIMNSQQNMILIAEITQVETISGIMRRHREGNINLMMVHNIKSLLDYHLQYDYRVVGLAPDVIKRARNLIERHPLRAYDAIQLSSALESHLSLTLSGLTGITFVSADIRLLNVANSEGLIIHNAI